jgi:alkanesulfonate monooxygenase SsuD/methylene tetrahydromethanopterin reductase-like flavin-dependent oxidoreductase (luciferase family)
VRSPRRHRGSASATRWRTRRIARRASSSLGLGSGNSYDYDELGIDASLIVAANGPRTRRLAARFGHGWNVFAAVDEEHAAVAAAMDDLADACAEVGRDPASLMATVDALVDPLDLAGARDRSRRSLQRLADLGVDEVRCYPSHEGTHASRMAAVAALAELRPSSVP